MSENSLLIFLCGIYFFADIINGTVSYRISSYDNIDPFDRTPLDKKIKNPTEWLGLSISMIGIVTKINFLILCFLIGYKTTWYYGLGLYLISYILTAICFGAFLRKNNQLQSILVLTSIGTLPLLNVILWILVLMI